MRACAFTLRKDVAAASTGKVVAATFTGRAVAAGLIQSVPRFRTFRHRTAVEICELKVLLFSKKCIEEK